MTCCLHLLALFFGKHSRPRCACHCSSELAISNMSRTSEMMSCKTWKANECVDMSNLCLVQACRLQACLFKQEWIYWIYSSFYGRVRPHTMICAYDLLGGAGGVTAVACRGKVPPSPPLALSDQLPPRPKRKDREPIQKLQIEATRFSDILQRITN